jgi:2-keto-4-pentenoate hydratase
MRAWNGDGRKGASVHATHADRTVTDLADRLWRAEVDRVAVAPLTADLPALTVDEAYAVQTHNVDRRVTAGAVVRGRKVGLTSRPVQDLLGVREPNFGVLLDDMFVDEGDEVPVEALLQPRVESEIAFLIGADLAGPGVTTPDALAAIGGVLPAVEVVDSRIADWRIGIADTVADNASSARVVVGARMLPVTAVDLRLLGVLFSRNGVPIESGAGAAVLGNPARCVAWLANKLGALGSGLRRGDVVLSGALHRMVPVRPGDVFSARFAHLGSVTVQFSGGDR